MKQLGAELRTQGTFKNAVENRIWRAPAKGAAVTDRIAFARQVVGGGDRARNEIEEEALLQMVQPLVARGAEDLLEWLEEEPMPLKFAPLRRAENTVWSPRLNRFIRHNLCKPVTEKRSQ